MSESVLSCPRASSQAGAIFMRVAKRGWVGLPVCNPGPHDATLLVEMHAADRPGVQWQALSLSCPVAPGATSLWVYIGPDIETLTVHAADGLTANPVQMEYVEQPPVQAWIHPRCRTVAMLHRLGVLQLREIELTDDDDWPLVSVGNDPQLHLALPLKRGVYRVALDIEAEASALSPTVYRNEGAGYTAALSTPMACRESSVWVAEVPLGRATKGLRIDPMAAPGRLRLRGLALEPTSTHVISGWWRWMARLARRVVGRWTADDLYIEHDLRVLDPVGHILQSTGGDPRLRLAARLPAGWYMAEVRMQLPGARADACFYVDTGTGESEEGAMPLPLRSGQLTKRLLYLPAPGRLRFDPMTCPGVFRIEHFAITRVTKAFARSRMQRKLRNLHPLYRRRSSLGLRTANPQPQTMEALWADYASLFLRSGTALISYDRWIEEVETPNLLSAAQQLELINRWTYRPRFSVIIPVWNTPPDLLRACLDSVLGQTYPDWELCITDDASTDSAVGDILRAYQARDARIKVAFHTTNGHIVEASNTALALAQGEFIVLLDHDDLLAPHALFAVAEALQARPSAQILYSDEDKLDDTGQRCDPYFKPDWSPDLLYSQNYISHLGVYRRDLVQRVGGFRKGFEGSQDYDLLLRCVSQVADARDIVHIPQVLYHWRMTPGSTARGHDQKDYASEAGRRALQDHFDAHHPGVSVSVVAPGIYRHRWPLPEPAPLVSLIVPTRDRIDVLRMCIDSLLQRTTYPHFEVLVVDNQSTCPDTLAYLAALARGDHGGGRVRVLPYDHPFNYSALNNFAAAQARGTVLGLINNDVEVITPDWLEEMVSHALRPDVGCVGAKLYYPDDTVQHAGVVLGLGGVANHALRRTPRHEPGYFGRLWTIYNPSAVTAAALVLRKEVFDRVGGLDAEGLPVAFNDVDLCLKVREAGYRNLWTPHAELYHHESVSRGADTSPEKRARFVGEVNVMLNRWGAVLQRDPAYNPNLTREREDYSLALAPVAASHRAEALTA